MIDSQLIPHKEKSSPNDDFLIVKKGLDYILDHFDPNALFPRTIMTKKLGYQKIVFSKQEALQFFIDSDFVDCRINAFPVLNNLPPDFIFIDLDYRFQDKISLDKKLEITLSQINKRLEGNPTVIWTGNGYHVYQPLECSVRFRDIGDFNGFDNTESKFLRFSKNYLSDGYSDHSNNPSLKSCLLRVPNSCNSKCISKGLVGQRDKVKLVRQWDRKRPSIGNLIGSFYADLVTEKINSEKRKKSHSYYYERQSHNEIQWIERLLKTPLEDHRKYCLWRIFIPYLLNIKNLSEDEVWVVLENWCKSSNQLRKLNFSPSKRIRENIDHLQNYLPISKRNLRNENFYIYSIVDN